MKRSNPPVSYLVGTPKGRLTFLSKKFMDLSWEQAREDVKVKLFTEEGELYILVESANRLNKERAIRLRKLKKLWNRLKQLQHQKNSRDQLLLKTCSERSESIGASKKEAGRVYSLVRQAH